MTDPLIVAAGERGIIRLFTLNVPPEQISFLREPGAVAQVLGVPDLDPDQTELVRISDLADLGLAGYLVQGFAIPEDQIDQTLFESVRGTVLMIRSRAFRGLPAALSPDPQLSLIAILSETPTDWSAEPMETSSARSRVSPRAARSQARRTGFSIFAVVMILIVALVFWVAI